MMRRVQASRPLTYFAYAGWLAAFVCGITYINWLKLGEYGWMLKWQLVAIGLVTLAFAAVSLSERLLNAIPHVRALGFWLGIFGLGALARLAWWIDSTDHRLFILAIALLQTCVIAAMVPRLSRRVLLWLLLCSGITWSLASGLTFTHLSDFFLNAEVTGTALLAFISAFGLVLTEFHSVNARSKRWQNAILAALAVVLFAAWSFRTDNLGVEWVPYHRSLFADVAEFVRQGHWLLWDVPSLYGFFSLLTLGLIPASNGFQALYELTGLFLTCEAAITFVILRWGRGGWLNAVFAVLFPLSTILNDAIARYPWSPRLYPQGGIRFIWVDLLLLVIFLMYVWRDHRRAVNVLRWAGHSVWLLSVLWSFECGLWESLVWIPYLVLVELTNWSPKQGVFSLVRGLARRLWPPPLLGITAILSVQAYYYMRLGHGPDWRGYVEFLSSFTQGIRPIFHLQYFGAGWTIFLALGSIGALGIAALREGRRELACLLAGAWLAAWITASYFAIEPIDMYVSLLLSVLAPSMAIALFASRQGLRDRMTSILSRYSLAPIAIISIAIAFGEPSRLAAMRLPFTPGWDFHVTQVQQPISGELARLMQRAGIPAGAPILIPNGDFWNEPERQGLIQPFVRLPNGKIVQDPSWLPMSPVGPEVDFNALPPVRQAAYIERFLKDSHKGGWYIAYRQLADCSHLSSHLRTVRSEQSTNFSISLCAYVP